MKWPSKYFWNMRTHAFFFSFFISCHLIFSLMNALIYVDIDYVGFHISVSLGHFIKHTPLISEECPNNTSVCRVRFDQKSYLFWCRIKSQKIWLGTTDDVHLQFTSPPASEGKTQFWKMTFLSSLYPHFCYKSKFVKSSKE